MTATSTITPKDLIQLIDLTRLEDHDTAESIEAFCIQSNTDAGSVAALCIFPQWISLVKQCLHQENIPIATVVNFPDGNEPITSTIKAIKEALHLGANEIDVVMPYQAFLKNDHTATKNALLKYKEASEGALLKVILETGAYKNSEQIYSASLLAIDCGADMIKTSTGKIKIGATTDAVDAMLTAIKQRPEKKVGIKISGGISDTATALQYIDLIAHHMGQDWINAKQVRIGSSRLVKKITEHL